MDNKQLSIATFGGGCFWCIDAAFRRVKGVLTVESGYAGGEVDHPTYQQICTGLTGHAEVVKITFDESKVSFEALLEMFLPSMMAHSLTVKGMISALNIAASYFIVRLRNNRLQNKNCGFKSST
eukprot:TRINITY_DN2543_c0_g1_i1.p1 TRINITY_DN2543_c0_g1~~TRINITY_DN2543_c0_g1_i1.p1  ORF type:complete len:124 (+),score=11.70 TRINITY_DN2543_c0_g1_i1:302-673(+)